jgi:hypothetical protein
MVSVSRKREVKEKRRCKEECNSVELGYYERYLLVLEVTRFALRWQMSQLAVALASCQDP